MDSQGLPPMRRRVRIVDPHEGTRRYVIVSGGVVVNSVVGDEAWRERYLADWPDSLVIQDDEAEIGWLYRDGKFSRPPSQESDKTA